MGDRALIRVGEIRPALLALHDLKELLDWYRLNLCEIELRDPRGHRVRFLPENFIHLIKLTNKYGKEPKNARMALEEIERGRMKLTAGHFDQQRAPELSWIRLIATDPWRIVPNWVKLGRGDEAYIRNFGTNEAPLYRVLVCEVLGKLRQPVTVSPATELGKRTSIEFFGPKNEEAATCFRKGSLLYPNSTPRIRE